MNTSKLGHCCIILHTHLPYVHHPEHKEFLEEEWLFEAILECYLPLLYVMNDLKNDGIPFRLAFNLTPPLLEMLATPKLMEKFEGYLQKRLDLCQLETKRQGYDAMRLTCAQFYLDRLEQMQACFRSFDGDLIAAFGKLASEGHIELFTSAATHGFLPAFKTDDAIRAQVSIGIAQHERRFGSKPRGFWLPECAYRPGIDKILAECGVEYTVLDGHAGKIMAPIAEHGSFKPVELPSGVAAFLRDEECSQQVWSSMVGYPGDPCYRELYRDIGFDADYRYILPFLHSDGIRRNIGLKYHRITGDVPLHEKDLYDPIAARDKARVHAENFLFNRSEQIKFQAENMPGQTLVTAPFDTELFGHWWFEGPHFLEAIFRAQADWQEELPFAFVTPGEVLDAGIEKQRGYVPSCSWGRDGFFDVWIHESNAWMWQHLHQMEKRMKERLQEFRGNQDSWAQAVHKQMLREMLLAQSSDWAFIVAMGTSAHYAERRFRDHLHRFTALDALLDQTTLTSNLGPDTGLAASMEELQREFARIEAEDAVFAELTLEDWPHFRA